MKKSSRLISVIFAVLTLSFLMAFSTSAANTQANLTLKASNVENGIQLTWNEIEGVRFYAIFRKEASEKSLYCIKTLTETKFTDENVIAGKRYGYRVFPVFPNSVIGTKSNDVHIYRLGTPKYNQPVNAYEGIRLTWSASAGAEGYYIFRKTATGNVWNYLGRTNAKTLTFTDKKVNANEIYSYSIRSYRGSDISHYNNLMNVSFLPTPKITKAVPNKDNITVSWNKAENAAFYMLFRRSASEKNFTLVKTLNANELTYVDKNVTQGTVYYYLVRSVSETRQISGIESKATSCLFMSVSPITSATNVSNGVKLVWTKVNGAHGYVVYRRETSSTTWKCVLKVKGVSTLTATDKTAANGKEYVYVTRGYYNNVQGPFDLNGYKMLYLAPVQNLKVESKGASGNYLTWTANKSATKYLVFRKTDKTSWQALGYTTKNSALDKTAKEGTVYTYTIRAFYNTSYCSAACATANSNGIDPKGKMVALTYDDGPSNSVTNDILDILQKYKGKATFFVVGSRISSSYQPMQRAVKMGCEIGNHTYSHIDLPSYYYDDIRYEIDTTNSLVKKYTGVTPKIVRAPGGSTDSYSRQAVNMPFIYWSIDTRDWESRSASSVISIVKSSVEDGDIILMHDIYDSTAEASETIIPWLVNQGYQLVTVSELMQYRGIKMQNAVSYSNAYR